MWTIVVSKKDNLAVANDGTELGDYIMRRGAKNWRHIVPLDPLLAGLAIRKLFGRGSQLDAVREEYPNRTEAYEAAQRLLT